MPKAVKKTDKKTTRVYGYTTERNGSWIERTAKKAKLTKANLVHTLIETARKEGWKIEGAKAVK